MRILHICDGWQETNGAAVIARLVAADQAAAGHVVSCSRWAGVRALRAADEVWIHCGWTPSLLWASLWARRSVRMPEACYDPVRLAYHGWKKRLAGPFERWALRRASAVVATCADEEAWIRAYEPRVRTVLREDVKRHFDLPVAAPPVPSRRPLHVLYLGRPHPLKGVDALRAAVRDLPDVALRCESGVTGAAKEAVWSWADALALPTLSDNFGLVVAEALARGKPVVVTDGAPAWADDPRVTYVRGFRTGTPEARAALLRAALARLVSR